jgi:hypothetical protein
MSAEILVYIALAASLIAVILGVSAVIATGKIHAWRRAFSPENHPENLEEIIESIAGKIKQLETESDLAASSLHNLAAQLNTATQFVGLIRYNSNGDDGGNLSFSLALLNAHQSGVVLTSLHGRQNNRIYAKVIKAGASEQTLSEEEKEALIQAVTHSS